MITRQILIVGHITVDQIDSRLQLGGAVYYASMTAAAYNYNVALVTAGASHELLNQLEEFPLIELNIKYSEDITTFSLDYSQSIRKIRLLKKAPQILFSQIPQEYRHVEIVYFAPVIGECSTELVNQFSQSYRILGAQGWLRETTDSGEIVLKDPSEFVDLQDIDVVILSENDCTHPEELARIFSRKGTTVAVTRASKGITLFFDDHEIDMKAFPATEVDPTGAGDTFGVQFGISMWEGNSPMEAAKAGMWAAARVVEGHKMGALPTNLESFLKPTSEKFQQYLNPISL